jgi:hypothetical protein
VEFGRNRRKGASGTIPRGQRHGGLGPEGGTAPAKLRPACLRAAGREAAGSADEQEAAACEATGHRVTVRAPRLRVLDNC